MEEIKTQFYTFPEKELPFALRHGGKLQSVTLAYETLGKLNDSRDNAILIFHALTGSQHMAGWNDNVPGVNKFWNEECQTGWWNGFVGPGKAIDTDHFFVVCANFIGGCYGSTGPSSLNPETGKPYGGNFPSITVADIVDSQIKLLDYLNVEKMHAVVGASIGGLLCLTLAARYPDRTKLVIPISTGLEVTALQRIYNLEQICAIEQDPNFNGGDYYQNDHPVEGLALARMIAHKNYVSLNTLKNRARSEIVQPDEGFDFYKFKYPIESYMKHQGEKFVNRFDANTYLRIIDAWQCFNLLNETGASSFSEIYERCGHQRYMVFSVDSDVCFYPEEQVELVRLLKEQHISCRHITIHSDKGHDAFLLEPELFTPQIGHCLRHGW